MTLGSLWNYYRDEIDDSATETYNDSDKINSNKTTTRQN